MRILESLGIPYEAQEYFDDGHVLNKGAALNLSEKLKINPAQVFKTIVMRTELNEIIVFCQSATHEINLKKARFACGAKEVSPVKSEDLLKLTGYIRGGCSPLGMKRKYRTFFDDSALLYDKIFVSAGVRGIQISVEPKSLIQACEACTVDLVL